MQYAKKQRIAIRWADIVIAVGLDAFVFDFHVTKMRETDHMIFFLFYYFGFLLSVQNMCDLKGNYAILAAVSNIFYREKMHSFSCTNSSSCDIIKYCTWPYCNI